MQEKIRARFPRILLNLMYAPKGSALDPPETLSLDSAGAPPRTLQRGIAPLNPTSLPLASTLTLNKRLSLLSAESNKKAAQHN